MFASSRKLLRGLRSEICSTLTVRQFAIRDWPCEAGHCECRNILSGAEFLYLSCEWRLLSVRVWLFFLFPVFFIAIAQRTARFLFLSFTFSTDDILPRLKYGTFSR